MTYTVRPVTQFALMREGQDTPVAIYRTEHEALAAAAMLDGHALRNRLQEPQPHSSAHHVSLYDKGQLDAMETRIAAGMQNPAKPYLFSDWAKR